MHGAKDDLYRNYHDQEWGKPIYDDETIFEFLILESFQAGLSWYTILAKRENFRAAFDQFDYQKIAQYSEGKVEELIQNAGIIRNRLKILATINNAQKFMEVQKEFGSFSKYIWGFVNHEPIINRPKTLKEVPATTEISDALAKDLKKRGFKFMACIFLLKNRSDIICISHHNLQQGVKRRQSTQEKRSNQAEVENSSN